MNSQQVPTDKHGVQCSALHKKRVLFVITKSVWGGAQRYVFDLATNLPKEEYEVAVALGPQKDTAYGLLGVKLQNEKVPIYLIKNFQKSVNPFKDMSAFWELYKTYRKFQPDIMHTNSSKASGIASAAALLHQFVSGNRVLRIFTVHGWAFLEPRPRWHLFLIRAASKLTVFLHDRIIVISQRDKHATLTYNVAPERKVTLIHNGIDTSEFLPRREAHRNLFGKEYQFIIGTIAEWTKNKGLEYLIGAMPIILASYPETKLCLIGWGEENERLQAQSKQLKIQDAVLFRTASPAAPYLKAFDIFVLPSCKEGLPYTLLEAGLAALPVVATNVGGIPDIIENGKSGILVDPASPDQLANAITKLSKDKNLREKMGQELQKRIRQDFSLISMLQKTTALYR